MEVRDLESPSLAGLAKEHLELALHLRELQIYLDADKCKGVWQCYEVCPVGCWEPMRELKKIRFHHGERCIACGACVLQCPEDAIELT
jgi:NAD-dependent dihydropyrimidine dehydrogenase PreA subunit